MKIKSKEQRAKSNERNRNKKRIIFPSAGGVPSVTRRGGFIALCSLLFTLCTADAVHAMEYCVPTYHTLTYQLGNGCNGTTPSAQTVSYMGNFTTPNAATVCGDNSITKWKISGTNNYITSNTTLPYVWFNDITLVAESTQSASGASVSVDYCANISNPKCNDLSGDICASGGFSNPALGAGAWSFVLGNDIITGITTCSNITGTNDLLHDPISTLPTNSMTVGVTGRNVWIRIISVNGVSLNNTPWLFFGTVGDDYAAVVGGAFNMNPQDVTTICGAIAAVQFVIDSGALAGTPRIYSASGITDSGNGACYQ